MDREKVIMALELHRAGKCQDTNRQLCPYWECYDDCYKQMADDILSLLKEQGEQIKNRDESLEKAREEIKWLRGMLKEQEAIVE